MGKGAIDSANPRGVLKVHISFYKPREGGAAVALLVRDLGATRSPVIEDLLSAICVFEFTNQSMELHSRGSFKPCWHV